ncbi:Mitochondrial large subunit ribosomal protein (Img2) domain containing protein [Hyaloscypha variabilis]|jgi:large subunit ribosomal protein L49
MTSSTPLLFLRPMVLPRASTIQRFLGIAKVSTNATKASSLPVPPPPPQATTPAQQKPYRVTLTPSKNYPIYTLAKRGGNMKLTKLRRIEGDVNALRNDLRQALGVDEKEVTINQLTKHIIVKGHKKPEIEKFLREHHL